MKTFSALLLSAALNLAWFNTTLSHPSCAYTCTGAQLPVSISTDITKFNLAAPSNQTELTGLNTELASLTSNLTVSVNGGTTHLDASYDIYAELCVPEDFKEGGTVELAVHGYIYSTFYDPPLFTTSSINFDHTYWSFGGVGSKYNYVEAAMNAGHAVLSYDRLGMYSCFCFCFCLCHTTQPIGIGKSSKPDGINEVQGATEVEITAELVKYLRSGAHGKSFGRVIGIGHSFGR